MIIFGSTDPSVEGKATEINDAATFWSLVEQFRSMGEEAKQHPAEMERRIEDFIADVEHNHGEDVMTCLHLVVGLDGGPSTMLDKDGDEVEDFDPKGFYDEHMYVVLNGEGELFVLTTGLDEAEDLYNELNAQF